MTKRVLPKASVMLIHVLLAFTSGAAERLIVLPVRLIGNFAIVTANIDGDEVPLVLDTGNSVSIALTQAMLDRLKATPTGDSSKGMDAKGNVITYPKFKIPRVQLESAVFTDVVADLDVHDPSYQATQVGQEGFLGTELLKAYRVVLDYRRRKMTLLPFGSLATGSAACRGTAVPFSSAWHGEPAAEAEIDLGRLTVWWDTGAPTSMLAKRFTDPSQQQAYVDVVTSKRLLLGGTDFGPLRFAVEDMALPSGFDGFIGANFFAGHVVCFDFPEKRILIRP